jgi:hypothetical protein
MLGGNFEAHFRRFVQGCGGNLIPQNDTESADFLFPKENIVAELKTLQADARLEHARKLQALVNDWTKRGLMLAFGRAVISLQELNPVCQREWLRVLQAPVEYLVRKANRQIRCTMQSLTLPTAKGLLLIANDGNLLHTSPIDYMILISRVLQKKTPTGERQFPHISGVVYFSYQITSRGEGMPFWISGHTAPSGDTEMQEFQGWLRCRWYSYIEQVTGRRVTEVHRRIPAK